MTRLSLLPIKLTPLMKALLLGSIFLFLLAPIAATGRLSNGAYVTYGPDLSCNEYAKSFDEFFGPSGDTGFLYVMAWISGYLTAFNAHMENNIQSITGSGGSDEALVWLRAWCVENPSTVLSRAMVYLVVDLEY